MTNKFNSLWAYISWLITGFPDPVPSALQDIAYENLLRIYDYHDLAGKDAFVAELSERLGILDTTGNQVSSLMITLQKHFLHFDFEKDSSKELIIRLAETLVSKKSLMDGFSGNYVKILLSDDWQTPIDHQAKLMMQLHISVDSQVQKFYQELLIGIILNLEKEEDKAKILSESITRSKEFFWNISETVRKQQSDTWCNLAIAAVSEKDRIVRSHIPEIQNAGQEIILLLTRHAIETDHLFYRSVNVIAFFAELTNAYPNKQVTIALASLSDEERENTIVKNLVSRLSEMLGTISLPSA